MERFEHQCLFRKTEYQLEPEGVAVLETELGNVVSWFIPYESMSWDYEINSISRPRLLWWGIPLLGIAIGLFLTGKTSDSIGLGIIAAGLIAFWKRSCMTFALFKAAPERLVIEFTPSQQACFENFVVGIRKAKLEQVDRAIQFIVDELKWNAENYVRWLASQGLLGEESLENILERLNQETERSPIGFQQALP